MELKQIALTLGLPETADEATVNAKLAELKSSKDEVEKMRKENDDLKLAQITAAVDAAVAAKKINADQKDHFIGLGKKVGIEDLNTTLAAMTRRSNLATHFPPTPHLLRLRPRARGRSVWTRSALTAINNNT